MPVMTQQELEEFLRRPLVVSFVTLGRDGSPHVSPIWYEYDEGRFYCWVDAGTVKARNVQRDSRVALCIATHDKPYKYVLVEGLCEIVYEEVDERGSSISIRYYGQEKGAAFAQEINEAGHSVLLVVTPTKMVTESAV